MLNESNQSSLDCSRVVRNDKLYIAEQAKRRIQFRDPPELNMDCETGIRWRNYFPDKIVMRVQNDTDDDGDYPLAQARVVYKVCSVVLCRGYVCDGKKMEMD